MILISVEPLRKSTVPECEFCDIEFALVAVAFVAFRKSLPNAKP